MRGRTSDTELSALKRRVQRYYRSYGRHHLPWRQMSDPYRILVSEVMLQQTQVDRVIPYYEQFLKQFPTARSLAKAPRRDVLAAWSGLGYNRRAKFLHEAAKTIVQQHKGTVPAAYGELVALPGAGDYTAKAVRAFAYNKPEVFIETNIRSVLLHELFADAQRVPDTELTPILEKLIARVRSPRKWYWALMDYGAYLKRTHGNAARRSAHHSTQSTFEGSTRQARGATMRALLTGSKNMQELQKATQYSRGRLMKALTTLVRDGLIHKERARWTIT